MTPALTKDEAFAVLRRMLPQGRAWQSHDGSIKKEDSVLQQVLYAVAGPLADADAALVAMVDEFFCSTAAADLDLWWADYGLPDACDPFATNLCQKVKFNGGVSLAYYEQLMLETGWSVALRWLKGDDAEFPGVYATLHAVINPLASPAYTSAAAVLGGEWELDNAFLGDVDAAAVACLLDRIIPAYFAITYEVVS